MREKGDAFREEGLAGSADTFGDDWNKTRLDIRCWVRDSGD
jgi:hypothetical protein